MFVRTKTNIVQVAIKIPSANAYWLHDALNATEKVEDITAASSYSSLRRVVIDNMKTTEMLRFPQKIFKYQEHFISTHSINVTYFLSNSIFFSKKVRKKIGKRRPSS